MFELRFTNCTVRTQSARTADRWLRDSDSPGVPNIRYRDTIISRATLLDLAAREQAREFVRAVSGLEEMTR